MGVNFVLVAVEPDALTSATPNIAAYRHLADMTPDLPTGRLSIFAYLPDRLGCPRARMFAPLAGTWQGSGNRQRHVDPLAALRLSLLLARRRLPMRHVQGVEMGRESRLAVRAWRADDGVRASALGGPLRQRVQRHGVAVTAAYSTVTDFARLRGWSTSVPFATAT